MQHRPGAERVAALHDKDRLAGLGRLKAVIGAGPFLGADDDGGFVGFHWSGPFVGQHALVAADLHEALNFRPLPGGIDAQEIRG